ncbi:Aerobic respiration control sensor protein ArcB [Hartmannibacter diazotrophicus]|uniref:histidine kinase n=1 Tax=Hartmannibacter diazotrophicus TaxID=1482074 RepID=A0A2C9D0F2_9HYPH|nr:hybrid sensor histidine kinase/response regulator [Hartmannibacter diazotrophicus]SON53802.1 Aerobic respiration control sensor protein ArcB [Hartmannibacter diazotrophicus]
MPPTDSVPAEDVAAVGHEIRNPVSAMQVLAGLLAAKLPDDPEAERLSALMTLAADHALTMADDLVALSAGDAARAVTASRFDPQALLRELADLHSPLLAQGAGRIGVIVGDGVPESFSSDPRRIRQVLFNLLQNAIRHSGQGGTELWLTVEDDRLCFSVLDRGPKQRPAGNAAVDAVAAQPGAGIGLRICRHLAKLLGGDLALTPREGGGMRADLAVPPLAEKKTRRKGRHAAPVASAASARSPSPDTERVGTQARRRGDDRSDAVPADMGGAQRKGDRTMVMNRTQSAGRRPFAGMVALVVDDSPIALALMSSLLETFGFEVVTAASGGEAANLAEKVVPDIVFVDWILGGESGADVVMRLKARLGADVPPVICITGQSGLSQQKAFAAILQKPYSPREIFVMLERVLLPGEMAMPKS